MSTQLQTGCELILMQWVALVEDAGVGVSSNP